MKRDSFKSLKSFGELQLSIRLCPEIKSKVGTLIWVG